MRRQVVHVAVNAVGEPAGSVRLVVGRVRGRVPTLQHLYRTVGVFLATNCAELERELFFRDRDLFGHPLDLVFIDTTSTVVWQREESALRQRGYSRDGRPDQPKVIIGLAVDRHGWESQWLEEWWPQRDSNPCFRIESPMS